MAELEISGFVVYRDQNGKPAIVEAEALPSSERDIVPDPRVMRQAREMLRQGQSDSDSSTPRVA